MISTPGLENHVKQARARRLLPLIGGGLLGACAVALTAAGGFAIVSSVGDDGFVHLGAADYHSASYAVASDPNRWSTGTFMLGAMRTVRVTVTPHADTVPTFLGLATPEAAHRYLAGVAYATGHQATNSRVTYTQHAGTAPITAPTEAGIWVTHTAGVGSLTLQFPARARDSNLVLVAMNVDGTAGVDGHVTTAATVPSLRLIGGVMLAAGAALLVGALYILRKRPRRRITFQTPGPAGH